MSEQIPSISESFTPSGIGGTPHSDLVEGLFREHFSRKTPPLAPETDYPNEDTLEQPVAQSSRAPNLPAPASSALPSHRDIPASEMVSTSAAPANALSLETRDPQPKGGTINPPPIHSVSTAVSSDPIESTELEWPELPYGQPLGPRPNFRQNTPLAGERDVDGQERRIHIPGYTDSPSYYFIEESAPEAPRYSIGETPGTSGTLATPFDVEKVRRDFPILSERVHGNNPLVFLDNAATTQKPQAVIDATSRFYEHDNSNIHRAGYELAERATAAFEEARDKVAQFLGARSSKEIVFTRGTTEAINLVANTFGRRFIGQGDEIILTQLEHHANIVPWQLLAKQSGAVIKVVPINDRGELILEEFVRLLGPRTKLVSVAHVSNSLGTVNPVEEIIQIAHAHGVHVLVDGAQSTPHIPINVQTLDADFLVFSGHKVFGPTGIGALYAKSHLLEVLSPWQGGGHMIRDVTFERTVFQDAPEKFEAGTPDIAGAVGLGAAIDYISSIGIANIAAYEHSLLEYATPRLASVRGLRPIGTAANKASVLSFVIPGIPNETIASHLDKQGIAVRAGHHCAQPSIRHFGLESSVRPSLAFYNTMDEIDFLVSSLYDLV